MPAYLIWQFLNLLHGKFIALRITWTELMVKIVQYGYIHLIKYMDASIVTILVMDASISYKHGSTHV